jgi:3-phenylpropionate/trans-cinnamate dioxygenase ferredoxin component
VSTTVGKSSDVAPGRMRAYQVDGSRVAIANVGGHFYAFGDTCTHQGCSLATGDLDGTTVTCSCHGSEFDVTTGAVLEGPAEDPVAVWPVELQGDDLVVRAPG